MKLSRLLAALAIGLAPRASVGADPVPRAESIAAARQLAETYPGVNVDRYTDRVFAVYGRPMTTARTAAEAANHWLASHLAALSASRVDLQPRRDNAVGRGGLRVFVYQQTLDGLPVENARTRLVVGNAAEPQVLYVGGWVVPEPVDGLPPARVAAETAMATVRKHAAYKDLGEWSAPEPVVWAGEVGDPRPPVRTWKFAGRRTTDDVIENFTFFVDATDGSLVHVRDEVCDIYVTGRVTGRVTPGLLPDTPDNPPVESVLGDLHVYIEGGTADYTDEDGTYLVASVESPVTVELELLGHYVWVRDFLGQHLHPTATVETPATVDFLVNPDGDELATAQVNAFVNVARVHDFYKARQPDFYYIDMPLETVVNRTDTCNALYSGSSIVFFRAGDGCTNTAYPSPIYHEYGHFIVSRLGLSQGSFGEGFADALAILMTDDARIGPEVAGPGTYFRHIGLARRPYPCDSETHDCGQVLAGFWWDLKDALGGLLGDAEGLELAQQLFTDWSQLTIGGIGSNAAHPITAIEVLIADDDDGDLTTGTPHACEICAAFAAHRINCPSAVGADCTGNGIPDFCEPDCNDSGYADSCDILVGLSDDCDLNGIPDECQTYQDCNDNGEADACEIGDGRAQDCNGNGVPDACDIEAGTCRDADANGIPDECILFVNADATGAGDGSNWNDAFPELQTAMAAAADRPAVAEVWVAAGTYRPDPTGVDRDATFALQDGLILYGGFNGSEPFREQRDPAANPTILSGDLNGDDGPDFANNGDNSLHVVTAIGVGGTAVLDGFTVMAGNSQGGALFGDSGGGLFVFYGSPAIVDCRFVGNTAYLGGGVYNRDSGHPLLTRCIFEDNRATGEDPFADGGGMYVRGAATTLTECTFRRNNAIGRFPHGGGFFSYASDVLLQDCVFEDNQAIGELSFGGAMRADNATLIGCVFDGNVAARAESTSGESAGGAYSDAGGSLFVECTFRNNEAAGDDSTEGGAVMAARTDFVNCRFYANTAMRGGAVADDGSSVLTNCVFTGNQALMGGAMFNNDGSAPRLTNCTIAGNHAVVFGGGVYNDPSGSSWFRNGIVWGNTHGEGPGESAQIYAAGTAPNVQYCCVEGWTGGWGGTGNINDDPLLVDPDGPDDVIGTDDDDVRISAESPALDAGNNDAIRQDVGDIDRDGRTSEKTPLDMARHLRVVDDPIAPNVGNPPGGLPLVDMGAYEYADCNRNGVDDTAEIQAGTSDDCNENGVPDACDIDAIHDCCESRETTGCSHSDIEACVCEADPFCCEQEWDRLCAERVESQRCGSCDMVADCNADEVPDSCQLSHPVLLMAEDFNAGLPGDWTRAGLWHATEACPVPGPTDPAPWLYFGRSVDCTFDTGFRTSGWLIAPEIPVPLDTLSLSLRYASAYAGERGIAPSGFDAAWVTANGEIIDDAGANTRLLGQWTTRQVAVGEDDAFAGEAVTLVWRFDSIDNLRNDMLGWQIDKIEVWAEIDDDCNTNGVPDACDIEAGDSTDYNANGRPDECDRPGDGDGDDDVDLADYVLLGNCLAGPAAVPPEPQCLYFDADANAHVSLPDFARFQAVFVLSGE